MIQMKKIMEENYVNSKLFRIGKAKLNYEQINIQNQHQSMDGHGPIHLEAFASMIDPDKMALHKRHMQKLRFSFIERYFWMNMSGSIGADANVFGGVPQVDEHDVSVLLSLRNARQSFFAWSVALQVIMIFNIFTLLRFYRTSDDLFVGKQPLQSSALRRYVTYEAPRRQLFRPALRQVFCTPVTLMICFTLGFQWRLNSFTKEWTDDMYDKYLLEYQGGGYGDGGAVADAKELASWDERFEQGALPPDQLNKLLKLRLQIQLHL